MNIAMLCGGFPPDFDAIGHYTWHLGNELVRMEHQVSIYTSAGSNRTPNAGMQVFGAFDPGRPATLSGLPKILKKSTATTDWLVLQYNPFSFGPRGFCPQLAEALQGIKNQSGVRIAIMFHETMVPRWPLKFAIMRTWQHATFSRLCHIADLAFVSTLRWLPEVRNVRTNLKCTPLPVGSNVTLSSLSRKEARKQFSVAADAFVIGIFGQAHVSRPLDWTAAAVRSVQLRRNKACVLYVGPDGEQHQTACRDIPFIDAGVLSQETVGACLRGMDFLLSPFTDGVSTRRGSFMAALQHGIPVATTQTGWTDKILTSSGLPSLLFSQARTATEFGADVGNWQECLHTMDSSAGVKISAFYEQHFSWPRIATDLVTGLRSFQP